MEKYIEKYFKIKIFYWFKFWKLDQCICDYFEHFATDSKSPSPWNVNFTISLLVIQLINCTILYLKPLDTLHRLFHCDEMLFWHCDQKLNILSITMCIEILYLFNILYFSISAKTIQVLKLIYKVLYRDNNRIFLQPVHVGICVWKARYISEWIRLYCRMYVRMVAWPVMGFVGKLFDFLIFKKKFSKEDHKSR